MSETDAPTINLGHRPEVRQIVTEHAERLGKIFPNSDSAAIVNEARRNSVQDIKIARLRSEAIKARENGEIDELTGLLNRKGFEKRFKIEAKRAKRTGTPLTFVFIDINGLKTVNDLHGHHKGDELIQTVGGTINNQLRETDMVARNGAKADEFYVVLIGIDEEGAREVCERINTSLKEGDISVAAGISPIDISSQETIQESIRIGEAGMYEAKQESHRTGKSAIRTTQDLTDEQILGIKPAA